MNPPPYAASSMSGLPAQPPGQNPPPQQQQRPPRPSLAPLSASPHSGPPSGTGTSPVNTTAGDFNRMQGYPAGNTSPVTPRAPARQGQPVTGAWSSPGGAPGQQTFAHPGQHAPGGQPHQNQQTLFPLGGVGYDHATAAAVAAAQHSLGPDAQYYTGGQYPVPRLDMYMPMHQGQVAGWEGSPPRRSIDEQVKVELPQGSEGGAGSRPGTAQGADGAQNAAPAPVAAAAPAPPPVLAPPIKVEGDEEQEDDKVDHRKRKRNRTIRSCVPCHNHKRKCDRKRPCGRCTALGLTGSCVYEVDEARDPNDPDVIETDRLRRRIAELEQVVRELRQRHPSRGSAAAKEAAAAAAAATANSASTSDQHNPRAIVDRYARFKMGEAAMASGFPSGTASGSAVDSTSPSSTTSRHHYAEPYSSHTLPGEELVSDPTGRKTFLGPPAGKPMFRRLREIVIGKGNEENVPEELAFTGWFSSDRKTFPFTTIWSHENFIDEIIGLLPTADEAEVLLNVFMAEIANIFQGWDETALKADYRAFFALSASKKRTQPISHLALYIMVCALASMVRASNGEIFGDGDGNQPADSGDLTSSRLQSELYLSAAYQALRLCSFLSSPTITTIQVQVLINVYLIHSERASDSWALTGSLVRQCIAMGLHVDPMHLDPKISLKEAEIRRRVWWTVAGIDALLSVSFGRPTVTNYYTCLMPRDVDVDKLSDEPGTAITAPVNNALDPETSDETFHTAYFQLTLPSLELLNRVFCVDPITARNTYMGWFTPTVHESEAVHPPTVVGNTYVDAIRLGRDIFDWYAHLPEGMRFDADDKSLDHLTKRSKVRINQTLALVVKTFILVLILHRPYLRTDPSAYPESSRLCGRSAHIILQAYAAMVRTKASIAWSWWTMSYRAFHAGTVCAFLAIREPGTELAERCLDDLRGAITIFENRTSNWNIAHPVQSDLCGGLVRLEKLATYAAAHPPDHPPANANPAYPYLFGGIGADFASAATAQHHPHDATADGRAAMAGHGGSAGVDSSAPLFPGLNIDPSVPAFPSGLSQANHPGGHDGLFVDEHPTITRRESEPFLQPWSLPQPDSGLPAYANTAESLSLPQIWASMFNIKLEPDIDMTSLSPTATMPPPPVTVGGSGQQAP